MKRETPFRRHRESDLRRVAKLDERMAMVILRSDASDEEMAELFTVHPRTIRNVRERKTFRHVC